MFSKKPAMKSPSIRQNSLSTPKSIVTKPSSKINQTKSPQILKLKPTPLVTKITQQILTPQKTSSSTNNIEAQISADVNKKSFATTVANSPVPKKEQAILIDINEAIPHKDYIIAIGNIVKPVNIIFASRISNKRLCIFLTNKALVDNLIINYPIITVNEQQFKIRKLHNPNKRIILSNVYPNIPHEAIENEFNNLNIGLRSNISFLRAGIQDAEFSHILSFRRQTFINHDDIEKLPSSILINYDDTNYRIFISDDSLTCFLCKTQGHIASNCPNKLEEHIIETQIDINDNNSVNTYKTKSKIENLIITSNEEDQTFDMDLDPISGTKRSLPESFNFPSPSLLDTPIVIDNPSQSNILEIQPKTIQETKKPKTISSSLKQFLENLDNNLGPAEEIFNENEDLKIDYITFKHLFENNQGDFNPHDIFTEYKITKEELLDILLKIKPTLKNKSIKNRLTRFARKIVEDSYESAGSEA
ncbi:unnamed protein product [Macrosiphum euphorbiae]|uniref:CCHC-type domain-containing protein n=1 Tax=Macrosiphum euphorbiae TaxID=13131 RepID=A0AAV0W8S4_9HEMI|nr:unnamed protein product [Macrosiphum euphorbiae]